ncbi:MAG: hypothetical protein QOI24_1217 [Acidobacteriota bacterium]|jgi:hypothetical protein|nr:hypothetical protein [Acidobacteriota bacterium]
MDPTNRERSRLNAEAFARVGAKVFRFDADGRTVWKDNQWVRASSLPDAFTLVFVHNTDFDHWTKLAVEIPGVTRTAGSIIRYTGGELPTEGSSEMWVRRRIIRAATPLTESEARAILEWSRSPKDPAPEILCSPFREVLPALALLCQGYLVASGNVRMIRGLSESAVESVLTHLSKTTKARNGRDAFQWSWFITPFDSFAVLREAMHREWRGELARPAATFLHEVETSPDGRVNARVVAAVLAAISGQLRQT